MTGWWFGFGYFFAGLWWIGNAFLVEAELTWLLPSGGPAPAGLRSSGASASPLAQLFWSEDWRRVFARASTGCGGMAAGHLLSGFPWNAIGYALTAGELSSDAVGRALGLYA